MSSVYKDNLSREQIIKEAVKGGNEYSAEFLVKLCPSYRIKGFDYCKSISVCTHC